MSATPIVKPSPIRIALAAVACAAAAAFPGAAAAAGPKVDVTLAASATASVQQGSAFRFVARISSDQSFTQGVFFDLVAPDGNKVTFLREIAVVPAGLLSEVAAQVTTSQFFAQRGTYKVVASIDGKQLGQPLSFDVQAPAITAPVFHDVTSAVGLATSIASPPCGLWTNGAAWADVDGDKRLDLLVTRMHAPAQLFINRANHFVDEAASRGIDTSGLPALGAVAADYDNDGDADLFVFGDGNDRLYRNDGTGHFADVTATAGVGDEWSSVSASWGDYDNDGWVDLYVTNHSRCAGDRSLTNLQYNPDHLYHNNHDGTFSDATFLVEHDLSTTLDGSTIGAGFQAAWFDYNDDGRQDLYLANDFLGRTPDRNHLYRNDGLGTNGSWQLTDVSVESGTSFSMNSMGIGIGDYDRDLKLDLAISNWGPNRLLHNNGDGSFTDAAEAAGMSRTFQRAMRRTVTWGPEFGDFNLDGWEDLYIAAGFLVGYLTEDDTPQNNEVFVNDRHGKFLDLSAPSGADDDGQSRGVAAADYDRDGDIDLYVVDQGGTPRLFRNDTPRGRNKNRLHWLEVNTIGSKSNRDGCGAKLILTLPKGVKMRRDVYCGGTSVGSGSSKIVHFGLEKADKIVQLEITWPSGLKQTYKKLKVDKLVTLTEPRV